MLVFFAYPYGSTIINGKRIYGYLERHNPVIIPWKVYKVFKKSLRPASYNKKILEKMFPGSEFPNISFTYHQIRYLNWEQMCQLCHALQMTTGRSNESRRRKLQKFMKENC